MGCGSVFCGRGGAVGEKASIPRVGLGGASIDDSLGRRWRGWWSVGGRGSVGGQCGQSCCAALGGEQVPSSSAGAVVGQEACTDLGPRFIPSVGTDGGPEGEQRIDVSGRPVH